MTQKNTHAHKWSVEDERAMLNALRVAISESADTTGELSELLKTIPSRQEIEKSASEARSRRFSRLLLGMLVWPTVASIVWGVVWILLRYFFVEWWLTACCSISVSNQGCTLEERTIAEFGFLTAAIGWLAGMFAIWVWVDYLRSSLEERENHSLSVLNRALKTR